MSPGQHHPSGWLLRRIPGAVSSAPGSGSSKAELAGLLHVRESDQVFVTSLMVCYRRGQIDFAWGYVVAPRQKDDGPRKDGPSSPTKEIQP